MSDNSIFPLFFFFSFTLWTVCCPLKLGQRSNISLWDFFEDLLSVSFMERSQLGVKPHARTNTEGGGLKMLIQTHTDEGCKSSPHCVFSTLAALCSSESLYSIELPSILTVAPSRHVQGAPTGALRPLNTHKGCLHTHLQTARRSKDPLVPLRPDATLCRVIIISWGMPKFIWRVGVCTHCCQAVWYEDICVRAHTIIVTGVPRVLC